MKNIYQQHFAAFLNVSAFVVMKGDNREATIAFKFPKDGAGRLYAYVHWIGVPMVRGHANGYGYDKKSAAIENAIPKILNPATQVGSLHDEDWHIFCKALQNIGGATWDSALREAGFTVLQAV